MSEALGMNAVIAAAEIARSIATGSGSDGQKPVDVAALETPPAANVLQIDAQPTNSSSLVDMKFPSQQIQAEGPITDTQKIEDDKAKFIAELDRTTREAIDWAVIPDEDLKRLVAEGVLPKGTTFGESPLLKGNLRIGYSDAGEQIVYKFDNSQLQWVAAGEGYRVPSIRLERESVDGDPIDLTYENDGGISIRSRDAVTSTNGERFFIPAIASVNTAGGSIDARATIARLQDGSLSLILQGRYTNAGEISIVPIRLYKYPLNEPAPRGSRLTLIRPIEAKYAGDSTGHYFGQVTSAGELQAFSVVQANGKASFIEEKVTTVSKPKGGKVRPLPSWMQQDARDRRDVPDSSDVR
jgi:hypothetical protein